MDDFHIFTVMFFKLLQVLNKEKILNATKEMKPVISDVESVMPVNTARKMTILYLSRARDKTKKKHPLFITAFLNLDKQFSHNHLDSTLHFISVTPVNCF